MGGNIKNSRLTSLKRLYLLSDTFLTERCVPLYSLGNFRTKSYHLKLWRITTCRIYGKKKKKLYFNKKIKKKKDKQDLNEV